MADQTNDKAETVEDGGPAFPVPTIFSPHDGSPGHTGMYWDGNGMTLRQYAAIHLRQPNSGVAWLDEMIRDAKRDELAAKAMEGAVLATGNLDGRMFDIIRALADANGITFAAALATESYEQADAVLAARNRK